MKIRENGKKKAKEGKQNIDINLFKSQAKNKQNILIVITKSVIEAFNA
jgi:hypothetical protein